MLKKFILILSISCVAFSSPAPERRIVGGGNAGLGQMPYMASIRNWGSTFHFSGGVIISDRWILSSANYLIGRADDSLNIVMGIIDLSATGVSRRSERIVTHPSFNSNTKQNDIACIMMVEPGLTFTGTVSSIFMVREVVNSGVAQTAGWGATDPNKGDNSQILRRLDVMIGECSDPQDSRIPHTLSNMCGRGFATGGICTSDVGGPLVTLSGLIGISSWHHVPCNSAPDVYARISWFANWIGSVTGIPARSTK